MSHRSSRSRSSRPPRKAAAATSPIPPLPPPPKIYQILLQRFSRAFRKIKIPGWLLLCLSLAVRITDWDGRLSLWVDSAHSVGGGVSMIASVISSPWFAILLSVLAICYLLFVGEPGIQSRKSHTWTYLTWFVFIIGAFGFVSILLTGYIFSKFGPRYLTDRQKSQIIRSIGLPENINYSIVVAKDITCADCGTYASDITAAIQTVRGWHVDGASMAGLSFQSHGLLLLIYGNGTPPEAELLMRAFKNAGIHLDIWHQQQNPYGPSVILLATPKPGS